MTAVLEQGLQHDGIRGETDEHGQLKLAESTLRESQEYSAEGLHTKHIYNPLRQDKELLYLLNLLDLIQQEGVQNMAGTCHCNILSIPVSD
jgi:hypothetical protein